MLQRPLTPLAFALSCFTAVLTPTAIDLGTCDDQVDRMRHTFDALETLNAIHVQDESWPLPVSSGGTSMFDADSGYILYGPTNEKDWPELDETLADIDTDQRMWNGWGDLAPRRLLYLALRPDVAIKHHWPALAKLAGTYELRLVIATNEPPPPAPPVPAWMATKLADRVLTSRSGFARLDDLRDVWAVADTCPIVVDGCTLFGWGMQQQLGLWLERAEQCHCAMIDEEAMTALAWRAFAPQGPPQRWFPLKIATTVEEQHRIATSVDPAMVLLPPNSFTVTDLVDHLERDPTSIFHAGEPHHEPPPEPPRKRRRHAR